MVALTRHGPDPIAIIITDTQREPSYSGAAMTTLSQLPDSAGRFGEYGGRYVPETLVAALDQLAAAYKRAKGDQQFQAELDELMRDFVGRPTALTFARRL
ncbi:MAG: hypothetical protein V3T84_13050, partial [Phycisphaerales bacterium]